MTTAANANTTTIADRVAKMDAGRAGQIPDEVLGVFSAEQAGLDARGIPTGIAEPGDTLGDFDLLDVHGAQASLSAALGGRTAVVVLYRGAWCPYCNLALRAYQDDLVPALADKGVALVAISPQKSDGSLSAQEKNALTFTVLSDPGNKIANRLGVMTHAHCRHRRPDRGDPLDRRAPQLHHPHRGQRHPRRPGHRVLTLRGGPPLTPSGIAPPKHRRPQRPKQ
jgi:peroxiredoxin